MNSGPHFQKSYSYKARLALFGFAILFLQTANHAFSSSIEDEVRRVKFTIEYTVEAKDVSRVVIRQTTPVDLPGVQEVESIEYSHEARKTSLGGQSYVEFDLEDPERKFTITTTMTLRLHRNRLHAPIPGGYNHHTMTPPPADILQTYLQPIPNIESDNPEIMKLANQAKGIGKAQLAQNLLDVVTKQLEYNGYVAKSVGALEAIKKGEGDCTEFSDLYVAVCRARGIPARWIEGFALTGDMLRHNWVEIYLDGKGWIPVDPLWNKLKRDHSTFGDAQNNYIYLSMIRNDEALKGGDQYYNFYKYSYYRTPGASKADLSMEPSYKVELLKLDQAPNTPATSSPQSSPQSLPKGTRIFTDRSGRKMEAEILGVAAEKVKLRRRDGAVFEVSPDVFSDGDQNYLKVLLEKNSGN